MIMMKKGWKKMKKRKDYRGRLHKMSAIALTFALLVSMGVFSHMSDSGSRYAYADTQASKSISLSIAAIEPNYEDNEVKLEISVSAFASDIDELSGIKFMISYPKDFKITDKKDEGYFGTQAYSISGEDGANPMIFALGCGTDDTTKTEAVTIKSGKLLTLTLKANKELVKGKKYEFKLLDNVSNGNTNFKSEAFLLETVGADSEYPIINTTYFRVKSQTTAVEYVPTKGKDVEDTTVGGSMVSWDNADNAVVRLYEDSSELTDKVIRADMRTDTRSKAVSGTTVVLGDKIETGTKTGTYTQSFTLSAELEDGTYKLAVYKPKKGGKDPYVVSVVKVIVSGGTATIDGAANGEVKMWLYGDVNDDGSVNSTDATFIMRYEVGMASCITGKDGTASGAHQFVAADVNGDGMINSTDSTVIMRYEVGTPMYVFK